MADQATDGGRVGGRPASALGESAALLALAFAPVAIPVGAHLIGQPFGIVFCVAISALIANFVPSAVPLTLLVGFLFQNLFISLVSPWIAGPDEFATIRGYNFLSTVVVWAVMSAAFWPRLRSAPATMRRLMLATTGVLGLIAAYFVYGAATNAQHAAIYVRNVATAFFVFQACLIAAFRAPGPLTRGFPAVAVIVLLYGYAELLARSQLFELVHAETYFGYSMRNQIESGIWLKELRETGRVIRGLSDMMTVDLFNSALLSDLKIRLYRLSGPNFHAISYAYALAVIGLFRLAAGRPFYALAALPLLIVIGSKGAIGLSLFGGAALIAFAATRSRHVLPALAIALACFSVAAILFGLASGDYHVVGLFGGINGFLKNPLGRGLGVGGNLSINMANIDWNKSQALGQADLAVESAVGTLLYQMGFAGLLVWLTPVWIAVTAFRAARRTGGLILAASSFAILVIAANGLLQEEALFAPLALGACMVFAGLALGETMRSGQVEAPIDDRTARASPRRRLFAGGPA